ncbi:hypothetical protein A4A49_38980 [Nicotiana attenuata]|uniref:Putative plant transposon protein domain-containing protein n=1 Tax=Nicotiana attenuata TaxID=49451 RepID=A0A1J6I645_NICAT|nr:hypothetical protein A4A49_38980 [Nicotiana attenuata]
MTGAQVVAAVAAMRTQPPGQQEFGINSIPLQTRDWYKRCRPKHIHPERAIQKRSVKAKYPAIWRGIQDLGLSSVFKNTGDINLNLVRVFYAGFDPLDTEELVPIRGRLIDFSAKARCDFLGAPNVSVKPLEKFIRRPTYEELRHTFCGVESTTAWVRDEDTNCHKRFPKKKVKAEAQVWLKLINARLLACNHDTLVRRVRTCVLYFLITGQKVNVGHLIRHQMAQVRMSKKIDRMPFRNFLTRSYCMRGLSFMAHLYGMMDLQLQIGGHLATAEERTDLELRYPLNPHAQQLVGVGEGFTLPADEDVNTSEQSEAKAMQSDDEGDGNDEEDEHDEEWRASEDDDDA